MPRKPTRRAPVSKTSKPFPTARRKVISGFPGIGTPHQHPLFQLAAFATRKASVPEKHAPASMQRTKTPAKQPRGKIIPLKSPHVSEAAMTRPPAKKMLSKGSKPSPQKR